MKKLKVKSVEGRTLPLAHDPKRHVAGTMEVPDAVYYRRALARGDIALATTTESAAKKEKVS